MNPLLIIGLLFVVLGVSFVLFNATRKKSAFPKNTSDLFWNVVFEWRWQPVGNGFEIIKSSIKKYCPNVTKICHQNLKAVTTSCFVIPANLLVRNIIATKTKMLPKILTAKF